MKRKILIAEPASIVSAGLISSIGKDCDFKVICAEDDFSRLDERVTMFHPDILIINPSIFAYGQISQLDSMFRGMPHMAIIAIIYQYTEPAVLRHFDFIIDINDSPQSILSILADAAQQRSHKEKETDGNYELTQRETEVLILVARGMMSKEIAEQLNISVHTVITHRKNITRKTGIKSVAGLAVYAMLNNLMDASDLE